MPIRSYGVKTKPLELPPRWNKLRPHAEQSRLWNSWSRFKVVPAGRRSGKCLATGTWITLANGTYKPIEEIISGDLVLSLNPDTYLLEPKPVEHLHRNGIQPIVSIKTNGRTLLCTPNHPILVNNEWKEAKDITKGDLLAVVKKIDQFANIDIDQDELDFLAIWLAEGRKYCVSNGSPAIIEIIHSIAAKWNLTPRLRKNSKVDWYLGNGDRKNFNQARQFIVSLGFFLARYCAEYSKQFV